MNLAINPNYKDICSVQLSRLNSISGEINATLMHELTQQLQPHINVFDNYWLVNTSLTINSSINLPNIAIFNVLLQYARHKCAILQITKN